MGKYSLTGVVFIMHIPICHGSYRSMRFSFQAGIILFPVDSLGERGAIPCIISLRESLIVRIILPPHT